MSWLLHLHIVFRGGSRRLEFPVPLPSRFDKEQRPGRDQQNRTDRCQRERPTEIVVLPVRHPIPSVSVRPEGDHCDAAADARDYQIRPDAQQEDYVLVVVLAAEAVEPGQEGGDEEEGHAEGEEELGGYEEGGEEEVVDYVVFFFEDPPAARESRVVVVAEVFEVDEAHLPQPCKQSRLRA